MKITCRTANPAITMPESSGRERRHANGTVIPSEMNTASGLASTATTTLNSAATVAMQMSTPRA